MKAYVIYDLTKREYISGKRRIIFETKGAAGVSLSHLIAYANWVSRADRKRSEFEVHEFNLVKAE